MYVFPCEQIRNRVAHDYHPACARLPVDREGRPPRLEGDVSPTKSEDFGYTATRVVQEADQGFVPRVRARLEELLDLLRAEKVRRQLLPSPPAVLCSNPSHDLGVLLVVPEMPLVEPFEGRPEVDLRPVLVVRLLDLRQDALEVRACRVHEGPPEQARESPQVAQVEVLSMNGETERAQMV